MNYFQPKKLEKALNYVNEDKFVIAAGCTDLLPATENNHLSGNILDITNISSLNGFSLDKKYRRIGATTTWSEIVNSNLPDCYEMLKDCGKEIGSIQIQNSGYYWRQFVQCFPWPDSIPCLLALDASVELSSINQTEPSFQLYFGIKKTTLKNELLTSILIPRNKEKGVSSFLKIGARKYLVISIAMAACRIEINKKNN